MTHQASLPEKLLGALFVLTVFALALTDVSDTDAWTHLAAGREIIKGGGIPESEPWLYAMQGAPFQYLSWLFGVLGYLAWSGFDMAGVVLLRATLIAAAFAILLIDASWRSRQIALSVFVLIIAILMVYYRFVFRPDIVLMSCLAFCIHALARLEHQPDSKAFLAIPLVALLWANVHGSIPLLLAPFGAFIAAAIAANLAARIGFNWPLGPSLKCVPKVLIVLTVSVLLSFANPNGWELWLAAQSMMSTDWFTDEITELWQPTWDTFAWPFVVAPCAFASFLLAGREASAYRFIILVPFAMLAFVAIRYGFLLAIVAAPIVAENIWLFSRRVGFQSKLRSHVFIVMAAFSLLVVASLLVRGIVIPFGRPYEYGLEADLERTPDSALAYLDRRGIEGRLLNSFGMGGYIIWRDYPKRRPFIDGRGALPAELLEAENRARSSPDALDELEERFGFSAIVVTGRSGNIFDPVIDHTLRHPDWALVFWDDVYRVFLRRNGRYAHIAQTDEYRYVKPDNGFVGLQPALENSHTRQALIEELRRCIAETGSDRARLLLGAALHYSGAHQEALDAFDPARSSRVMVYRLLAEFRSGLVYQDMQETRKAREAFERALAIKPFAEVQRALAASLLQDGEPQRALEHLLAAAKQSKSPIPIYALLVQAYRDLGREADARVAAQRFAALQQQADIKELFNRGVSAMVNNNYTEAVEAFLSVIEQDPNSAEALSNLGYAYHHLGNIDQARHYQQAALRADPTHANSHYGLSLVYEQSGDRKLVLHHLEKYLELEPAGYFSRRAKERLRALR